MAQSDRIIEVTGYIKKVETLVSIESNIMTNTCVLESLHPFPGYHGSNMPDEEEPRSIFLLINNNFTFEEVARITKKIHSVFGHDFYASIGSIFVKPYTYPCIRIKHLSSFTYIPQLQEMFSKEGVKFVRYRNIQKEALIIIKKNFLVQEQEEGIYKDMTTGARSYIKLPEHLNWDSFKTFTFSIKNNIIDNNFDAALGVFYRLRGIVDLVRIYDHDNSISKMRTLKKRYAEQVRKSYK